MIETRDLLLHPIRLRIVQALVGDPMTPLQLKDRLGDVPQATLYRHVKQLADGGLLEVTGERPVRGGVERTYGVVAGEVALDEHDLGTATPEEHVRYFATFLGTLLHDFASYLGRGEPALADDRVGYRQVALWLSDEELDGLTATIADAIREHADNQSAEGRHRRLLSTVLMPGAG